MQIWTLLKFDIKFITFEQNNVLRLKNMPLPKYYKLSISEDCLSCHKYRKQFYDIFVDGTYIGVRQHDGVPWHFT